MVDVVFAVLRGNDANDLVASFFGDFMVMGEGEKLGLQTLLGCGVPAVPAAVAAGGDKAAGF